MNRAPSLSPEALVQARPRVEPLECAARKRVSRGVKRAFDIVASSCGLVLLAPLLLVIAVLVKATSAGPILFRHERIGRNFQPFFVLKFRTMVVGADKGRQLTTGGDPRVTPMGRLLRRTKLDELPQLFNVLMGQMSLVGPRPEVRLYVEKFADDYAEILSIRPGITDPASIQFRQEEQILAQVEDSEAAYLRELLPAKIRLSKDYVRRSSLLLDLQLILQTLRALLRGS